MPLLTSSFVVFLGYFSLVLILLIGSRIGSDTASKYFSGHLHDNDGYDRWNLPFVSAATATDSSTYRQRIAITSTRSPSISPTKVVKETIPSNSSPSKQRSERPSIRPKSKVPTRKKPMSSSSSSPFLSSSPSLTPSESPTKQPSVSPSVYYNFTTLPCSLDPTLEGYEDLESFLSDIELFQVEQPFVLCPNATFEDVNLVIEARDSPLIIVCGGQNNGDNTNNEYNNIIFNDCTWIRSKIQIIGPTAPVIFRGIQFEESSDTQLVVEGSNVHVLFESCTWIGNSAGELIKLRGKFESELINVNDDVFEMLVKEEMGTSIEMNDTFNDTENIGDDAQDTTIVNSTKNDRNITSDQLSNTDVQQSNATSDDLNNMTFVESMNITTSTGNNTDILQYESNTTSNMTTTNNASDLNATYPESDKEESVSRYLKENGISVYFWSCFFLENEVSTALIASDYAMLEFRDCIIQQNEVTGGSILYVEGGILNTHQLRFERNTYVASEGIVTTSGSVIMNYTDTMCSFRNTPSIGSIENGCEGIFIRETEECTTLENCNTFPPSEYPTMSPSLAPSFVPRDCYDTLQLLQAAVIDAETRSKASIIRVCSGTILDGNVEYEYSPIRFSKGEHEVICGSDGSLAEDCIIFGGALEQIYIGLYVKSVSFSGFSMVGSRQLSVLAAGDAKSKASFKNCQWKLNQGIAAIFVYSEEMGETYWGQRNLEQLQRPSKPSMMITLEACYFEENQFSFASLVTMRGRATLKSVLFRENTLSRAGAIGAMITSAISLHSSCFLSNTALVQGIVGIDATSNITNNVANYGKDNGSVLGNCSSIFNDVSGTCLVDGNCEGDCIPFSSRSCDDSLLSFNHPIQATPPPFSTPTKEPELPTPLTNRHSNKTHDGNETGIHISIGVGQISVPKISSGAIVLIAVLILIVLYSIWACCCKKSKKEGDTNKSKGTKKVEKVVSRFKSKKKGKESKAKKKRKSPNYDEFDDYDNIDDDDGDDNFYDEDDDDFKKKSKTSSSSSKLSHKQNTKSKGSFFQRKSHTKDEAQSSNARRKSRNRDKEDEEEIKEEMNQSQKNRGKKTTRNVDGNGSKNLDDESPNITRRSKNTKDHDDDSNERDSNKPKSEKETTTKSKTIASLDVSSATAIVEDVTDSLTKTVNQTVLLESTNSFNPF